MSNNTTTNQAGKISRRALLRGTGAALALPWLEAMGPLTALAGEAAAAAPPKRLAVLFMPNGVHGGKWTPRGEGDDFELSETLAPLEKVKQQLLVFSNLSNAASMWGDGHYVKTASFLTGTRITKTTGKDLRSGGVSLDQAAARHLGEHTYLPSLELGTERVSRGIDPNVGFTRLYGSHISWRTPTMPLAREINPRQAFDRLFRSAAPNQADRSVLDMVRDDAHRLQARVGQADRHRLDEYLETVRALERRLAISPHSRRTDGDPQSAPPEAIPNDYQEHVRLMLDLMVVAFRTDATRVTTFMFGNAVSGRDFSFLEGVSGGHHEISHHQDNEEKLAQYQRINLWHIEQLAYLLDKMQSIGEGESTLLDNSMVLFGSGIRDGNRHDPKNLPILLAGRGGGALKMGRHVVCEKQTPLCNLYQSMLEQLDVPVDQFGDSTGRLTELG